VAPLLFACGALASCRGPDRVATTDAGARVHAPAAETLRDEARLTLERHCGACHIRDEPTALPRALAVYDLREPDWSARMNDAQLHDAVTRLGEPLPPDGKENDVSPAERATFARFVDAEVARRSSRR
jgi:hypothetical protein